MFQHSPKYVNDRWSQKPCRNTTDPFTNHAFDCLADFADMTTPSDEITASDISLVDDQPLNGGPFKITDSSVFSRSRNNTRSVKAWSRGAQNSSRAITNSRRQKLCKFIPMIHVIYVYSTDH